MNEVKKQHHIYKVFTAAENTEVKNSRNVYMNAFVPFSVKKVKINFTYSFSSDFITNIIITSDTFDNDAIGTLSKFSYDDGVGNLWFSDNFRNDNSFTFIFDSPKVINNSIKLSFTQLIPATIGACNIIAHMEFLG